MDVSKREEWMRNAVHFNCVVDYLKNFEVLEVGSGFYCWPREFLTSESAIIDMIDEGVSDLEAFCPYEAAEE